MTFCLGNQKKITIKTAIKKVFKKSVLSLFIFLFVFSITNIFFNGAIRPKPLGASIHRTAPEEGQPKNVSPRIASDIINDFPDISAESAIILEYETGTILWEKNSSKKLFPASLTKIMTGIIAIEEVKNLYDKTTISKNASGFNNSFFPFSTGDEITIMDLLKAALINSNNNATIALAEYISGSEAEFIKKMNAKAIEIGAYNTNFQSTNGLDSNLPEHKSTAKDLAVIAGYCMKNDLFMKIVSTKTDYINISGETIRLFNTGVLLFFDYVKGVKTGFTNKAGYCLILFSERQGLKLISVVLNSAQGMRESDTLKMINWANDNYSWKTVVDSSQIYKELEMGNKIENNDYIYNTRVFTGSYPQKDFVNLTNINDAIEIIDDISEKNTGQTESNIPNLSIDLPINKGQHIGNLRVIINGQEKQAIQLQSGAQISQQYLFQDLRAGMDIKLRNMIILLISFYFLIFILIIVRNLFLRRDKPE
jgi:serine-type D-Ala-D-Ala carboxypeptidase (penicillin-binding protein 5/6)